MTSQRYLWELLIRHKGRFIFFAVVIVGIAVWATYANTHAHGIIEGRVVNTSGKALRNVEVVVRSKQYDALGPAKITTTDNEGKFQYRGLPMLQFMITAHLKGYDYKEGHRVVKRMFPQQDLRLKPLVLGSAEN